MQVSEGRSKAKAPAWRKGAMKRIKNNNSGKQMQLSKLGLKWQTLK